MSTLFSSAVYFCTLDYRLIQVMLRRQWKGCLCC